MDQVSRRSFLGHTAAAAGIVAAATGVTGATGVLTAIPAEASGDDYDGKVFDEGGEVFDIKSATWNAKGDTVIVEAGASMASNSTVLTWPSGNFVAADAGKVITVQGAGANGTVLSTTITSVQSATRATLTQPGLTAVNAAEFAYGTDDTSAIVKAITAAEGAKTRGTIFVPPGIYMIRGASNTSQSYGGPVTFGQTNNGPGGVIGCGGKPGSPSSVFLCGDATAGVITNGWAFYQGFLVDGNNLAPTAMQNGIVDVNSGCYGTFIDVWARRAAGTGWAILGNQNHSYYSCGSLDNATDGLYIDNGAAGLDFWNFQEANSGRYGVHGDFLYITYSGAQYYTVAHFFGGTFQSTPGQRTGVSKVYLRNTVDWEFVGTTIIGDNLSGPTIDLTQGELYGYGTDFTGCTISSTVTPGGANPGHACFQIGETPMSSSPYTMVKTDGVRFLGGDTSIYIEATGSYLYSARDWVEDATVNGPVAATGLRDIDTLLAGRTGRWVQASPQSPWSGNVYYRISDENIVQLKGSVTSSTGGGGQIFTLASGYYSASGSTMQMAAALSNGTVGYVSVGASGAVSGSSPGSSAVSLYLDGISFPLN